MNRLRKWLLKLLFPELKTELKQIDENFKFLTDILKRHDNILRDEVWEAIKEKYENHG